jgi:hypothetical protein
MNQDLFINLLLYFFASRLLRDKSSKKVTKKDTRNPRLTEVIPAGAAVTTHGGKGLPPPGIPTSGQRTATATIY